jgi:hypothetical protein
MNNQYLKKFNFSGNLYFNLNLKGNNVLDEGCKILNEILQNSKIENISLESIILFLF